MCYSSSLKALYEDEEAAVGGSSASEDLVALLISRDTILYFYPHDFKTGPVLQGIPQ